MHGKGKFNSASDVARKIFQKFGFEYHHSEHTRAQRRSYITPGFSMSQRTSTSEDFFMDQKTHKNSFERITASNKAVHRRSQPHKVVRHMPSLDAKILKRSHSVHVTSNSDYFL